MLFTPSFITTLLGQCRTLTIGVAQSQISLPEQSELSLNLRQGVSNIDGGLFESCICGNTIMPFIGIYLAAFVIGGAQ